MTREQILAAVAIERTRQAEKWNRVHEWGKGDCSSPTGSLGPWAMSPRPTDHLAAQQYSNLIKAAVLAEEAGEVVKAALDDDPESFRTEVIQVAAVAFAILEGL